MLQKAWPAPAAQLAADARWAVRMLMATHAPAPSSCDTGTALLRQGMYARERLAECVLTVAAEPALRHMSSCGSLGARGIFQPNCLRPCFSIDS